MGDGRRLEMHASGDVMRKHYCYAVSLYEPV